jgi:hypothetical protein
MASADFNNVTLRNIAPANADGSFIRPGYVFTIGPDSKQYWTNTLYLDRIIVSTIYINSTLELRDGKFITLYVSTASFSTLNTAFINVDSTITASTMNAGNITYSTLTGILATTTSLTASTTNTTNLGFSTGSGLALTTNRLTVNSSIITSTLNGINLTYSTLVGSTITTSTMTASTFGFSTTTGSTLTTTLMNTTTANVNNGFFSTLTGSSIVTSTLSVSSLYYSTMVGSTIQTSTLTASTIGFSTTVGSTLSVALLNQNNGFFSTLTGGSLVTSTLSVSSLYYSTLYGSTAITSTLVASTIGFSTTTGSTLTTALLNVTSANVNGGLYSTLLGSTLTTSTLFASTLGFSTASGSTLTTNILNTTNANVNSGFYSTLVGSTLTVNFGLWNSTLIGSTINTMNGTYSTLVGSTLTLNTGISNSTFIGSTMNAINVTYSTLQGLTISANTISVGALTIGSTLTASTITTTSLGYSTMNGSTITASTINIASLLTISSGNVGIGMTNPTYALQASTLNNVNLSGNYIQDWTTVFSNSDSTAFTCTFNGTLSGPSGSPSAMNVLLGGSTNAVITFNNNIVPGNVYQLTINARMSGSSPYFMLCDHIANDVQIAGTAQQALTGTYTTYVLTFTAPSASFALSCIAQGGTTFSYYGVQLRAFFNQMIGGLGIGTTNPSFSLHVPKGSIQGYNLQSFEWINTQSNNRIGYNPAASAGLYKVATMGASGSPGTYGMINVRGQIGGWLNGNSMYVDLVIISRTTLGVWGTVYGNQSSAALQCDVVYNLNTSSQYDIYIHIKSAAYIVYDLVVSGASGNNILYDPAAAAMVPLGTLAPVSLSAMANVYSYGSNGGNVGIGKTNPAYTLDINGTLNASQILQNGAPLSTGGGGGSSQWITSGSNIYYLLGNVGISTNSPTSPLHIYGSGQRILLDGSSAAQTYIMFSTQGVNRGYIGTGASGVDMVVNAYASQNLIFQAGGGEYMRITSSGYVGINTNSPSANLHIHDTAATSSNVPLMVFSPNLSASGSQYLYFGTANSTNNTAQLGWYNVGAGSTSNYAFLQIFGKANIMTWQASSGNVGIGVTNPVKLFQVAGNGLFGYIAGSRGGIFIDNETAYTGSPCIQGVSSSFGTNTIAINPAGGNVAINATTSSYPLHVVGNINLTGSILYNGVAITTGTGSIWTAGGGGVAYYNGGNVGIGTASPATLLHLYSSASNTFLIQNTSSTGYASLYFQNSTPANVFMGIGGSAVGGIFQSNFFIQSANGIVFNTNGNNSNGTVGMIINSSGNVGIGTATPTYPISVATTGGTGLEVNRTGASVNFGVGITHSLTSSGTSFRGEYAFTFGGATTIATSAQTQAYGYYGIDLAAGSSTFGSNSSYTNSYFFVNTSVACFPKTNVGIGITNPTSNLHVGAGQTANLGGVLQTKYTDMGLSVNSTFTIGYNSSSVILSSGVVTYTLAGLDSNGTFSTSVNIIPGATYLFSWTVKASVASATVYFYGNSNAAPSSFNITNTYATYTLQFVASSDPNFSFRPYVGANQSISFNAISITRLDTVATGSVGIGINAPAANLHVYNSSGSFTSAPTVQIGDGQVDSGGAYGMVQLVRANGTADSKSHIAFIKNGVSVYSMGYYPITGGGPFGLTTANNMNSTFGIWLATTGNVGIGMTNPTALLQLNTDSAVKPGTTTWSTSSDERLKENIVLADVDRCVEIVRTVPLKHYRWKDEAFTEEQIKDRSKLGWIAQDVEKVFPKAVSTRRFAYNQVYENIVADDGSTEKKLVSEDVIEDCHMFNADQMYAVMYGAIQKLIAANDELVARIEALENKS